MSKGKIKSIEYLRSTKAEPQIIKVNSECYVVLDLFFKKTAYI
jgi:hypothetical protein